MIQLEQITRIFKVGDEDVPGLDHVDLDIKDGEYLSIMGPSGSGKSTLLNVLGLLDQPDSGRYLLDGEDVAQLPEARKATVRREKIGFVFQAFHLVPRLTAEENIALPLTLAGVEHREKDARVRELLDAFRLSDRARHRPNQLSGGQRQRVAIARAVVTQPGLLLADEPTGNLDHRSGLEVIEILEKLNDQGITLLIVTHDHELGERAHRRINMMDGLILED
ncbi:MAG: ABC transporter ATP-binding protein [Chromatiales bacterium]|jgi:putative ABC transport system ATP-binding protein